MGNEIFVSVTHILPHPSMPRDFFNTVSTEAHLVFDGAAKPGKHVYKDARGILMLTFEPDGEGRFHAHARMSGSLLSEPYDGVLGSREFGTVTSWHGETTESWVFGFDSQSEVGFDEALIRKGFEPEGDGVYACADCYQDEWPKGPVYPYGELPGSAPWGLAGGLASKMLAGAGENPVFSPACLADALLALRDGSSGGTRAALDGLLGRAKRSGREPDAETVERAVGVWIDEAAEPSDAFLRACERRRVAARRARLSDPACAKEIEAFVADGTHGMLAPKVGPSPDALALLASFLYFKDAWEDPFETDCTEDGDFFLDGGGTSSAAFMHKTGYAPIMDFEGCAVSSIGYEHGGRMVLVLPDDGVSIDKLVESGKLLRAAASFLDACESGRHSMDVDFALPRFETACDFGSLGRALGLGEELDLGPMCGARNAPAQIAHGARVVVSEQGTEAAAYTMVAAAAGLPPVPRSFTLNRPFGYAIVGPGYELLFLGVVRDPKEPVRG